ncbi:quinoprotein relay system zinc metallohydrolase 2 [Actibacterium ureilyticum]|uniref:quinoprotein relay system zinc metallohydrolase 2 n=1 Tax=Actibacterium ureilyticum TaxID=1590614 RepID=UPI000BAAC906|nr:quinoprotein relay system zinc metallohydrolase 2 [Actibacterium ureilyticum]
MFEALLSLCLAADPSACRDTLLPGIVATSHAACVDALASRPPDAPPAGTVAQGAPFCAPAQPGLSLVQVAPGVFVHMGQIAEPDAANGGDVANLGVVIGDRSVAVIDAGSARWVAEDLRRAIRARTDLPVSHLILTHMHPDHVLGAAFFADAGATVVGHAGLDRALADRQQNYSESLSRLLGADRFLGSGTAPVDVAVTDRAELDLGGRVLQLRAWPRAHTRTDLTVFDAQTGVFFAGDLVFERHIPALDGSLRGWQAVLAQMADLPVTALVPGHGGPVLDWPDGAAPMLRYLDVLVADTRTALDQGERLGDAVGQIAASEAPHWALFDAFNARNATVAFTELEWE